MSLETPRFDAFVYRWPGVFVAATSLFAFLAGLGACAARDWHAPRMEVIVLLVAGAVGLGLLGGRARWAILSELDRRKLGEDAVAKARAAHVGTTLIATAITAVGAAIGSAIAYVVLGPMSRVPASFVAAAWLATIPLFFALAFALLAPRVSVGLDAICVGRKVVRLRRVRGVRAMGRTLVLDLDDGTEDSIVTTSEHLALALAGLVQSRLEAAAAPAHVQLARSGRSLEAWRRALLPTYREGSVPTEEIERVLWSAGASPDERVGAALVLASAGQKERVRVAAGACADPRVRVALEHVAEDALDEAELDRLGA